MGFGINLFFLVAVALGIVYPELEAVVNALLLRSKLDEFRSLWAETLQILVSSIAVLLRVVNLPQEVAAGVAHIGLMYILLDICLRGPHNALKEVRVVVQLLEVVGEMVDRILGNPDGPEWVDALRLLRSKVEQLLSVWAGTHEILVSVMAVLLRVVNLPQEVAAAVAHIGLLYIAVGICLKGPHNGLEEVRVMVQLLEVVDRILGNPDGSEWVEVFRHLRSKLEDLLSLWVH